MDLNILGLTYFLILKRRMLALFSLTEQCRIQSYFEAGIPVWDPKLKPPNAQKC